MNMFSSLTIMPITHVYIYLTRDMSTWPEKPIIII